DVQRARGARRRRCDGRDRRTYVERNGIDPAFAFPAANWARADGEVKSGELFELMRRLDPGRLSHLRAVVPFFTGYMLYDVRPGHEYNALYKPEERRPMLEYSDADVAENLAARNGIHVERWEPITQGLPVRCLYAPPHRFGETGELRRGIILNHDTVAYQERIGLIHDTGLLQYLDERSARQGELRVLEIGGGYGALGYWFKSA